MSLDEFQENFQEWIVKTFKDRKYILGRAKMSQVTGKSDQFPAGQNEKYIEAVGRVYDLYNPTANKIVKDKSLEKKIKTTGSLHRVEYEYQSKGEFGGDSDFLHVRPEFSGKNTISRIYINYDHSRKNVSIGLCRFLNVKMFQNCGIIQFKVAGPSMPEERKDSIVIWLDTMGTKNKDKIVLEIDVKGIVMTKPSVVYGAKQLLDGKGFGWAMDPKSGSFGTWLSRFLLNALIDAHNINHNLDFDINAFCDKLKEEMNRFKIDIKNIYLLSELLTNEAALKKREKKELEGLAKMWEAQEAKHDKNEDACK